MVAIMERFKWDYYTYLRQPKELIINLHNYDLAESKYSEKHGSS